LFKRSKDMTYLPPELVTGNTLSTPAALRGRSTRLAQGSLADPASRVSEIAERHAGIGGRIWSIAAPAEMSTMRFAHGGEGGACVGVGGAAVEAAHPEC
jgi:hypothetical protein